MRMALSVMATSSLALTLFGCSKSGTTAPTQLAAKLGTSEVTLYEVDRVVTRLPATPPGDMAAIRKRCSMN